MSCVHVSSLHVEQHEMELGANFSMERDLGDAKQRTEQHVGGQLGNRNAYRHGRRAAAAVLRSRLARAELKALAFIGLEIGILSSSSVRNRPLRPDQLDLLRGYRPQLLRELFGWGHLRTQRGPVRPKCSLHAGCTGGDCA